MEIRKCTVAEAAAVGKFYDATIKFMDEHGVKHSKWLYKIFPTTEYAVDAARALNSSARTAKKFWRRSS